jgi:hypothetical protein
MRKILWIIAFLVFVPCAKADTLDFIVTSGVITLPGGPVTLLGVTSSGDAFTATGSIMMDTCEATYHSGEAITACPSGGSPIYFNSVLAITGVDGVESVDLGDGRDFALSITTSPIYLSGATQATLSEPAEISGLVGCYGDAPAPPNGQLEPCFFLDVINAVFEIPGPVVWTVNLVGGAEVGYEATSEELTITAPEPRTGSLVMIGLGLLGLAMATRNRLARDLPQVS